MLEQKKLTSISLLFFSTLFWGAGFVFIKWLQPFVNPFESNHLRFYLAGILIFPYILYQRFIKKNRQPITSPANAAIMVYLLLTLQTSGLYYTSVAKAGFLTTLYVIIIPLVLWVTEKRKFNRQFIFCCFISVIGVFLLNNANFSDWNRGDTLVSLCAIFAAIHIVYIEKIQPHISNPFLFNAEQCLFLALYSLVLVFLHDDHLLKRVGEFNHLAWYGLLSLSILSSILAFSFQVYAQKNIPSQVAGLLFLLESPFAALLAFWWLGEAIAPIALVGAGLVILSSVITIFKN